MKQKAKTTTMTMTTMNKIKAIRKQAKLSQSQFAEKFHLQTATVQAWEQGRRNVPEPTLYMIERILELETLVEKEKR